MVLLFDDVQIVNMALGHVGNTTRIQSFSQKNNTGARLANQYFQIARAKTLEAYNWGFARRRVILTLKNTISEDNDLYIRYGSEWQFMFAWPNEALKVRKIISPWGDRSKKPIPYEIDYADDGTKVILCNIGDQAVAQITVDIDDPSVWNAHFVDCLSYQLAFYFAWPLTKKTSVQASMKQLFDQCIARSSAMDTHGEQENIPPDTDWIQARN